MDHLPFHPESTKSSLASSTLPASDRALANLPEAVLLFDAQHRLIFSNPACAGLLDLPAEMLAGWVADHSPGQQIAAFQLARGEQAEDFAPEQHSSGTRCSASGKTLQFNTRMLPSGGWLRSYCDISPLIAELEAKSASEVVLRFALEGAGDGVWDWDVRADVTHYSRRWKEMMGFSGAELESDVCAWAPPIHPDDFEPAWAAVRAHLAGQTAGYVSEHRRMHKDGKWRWLLARGMVASRDVDGQALRMTGTSTDITARKHAEEQLLLAANVFKHAREGIVITDAVGRIIEVNETFEQITAYSRAEVQGQTALLLRSELQKPKFYTQLWRNLQTSDYWSGELWIRRKGGETIALMLTISAVKGTQGETLNFVSLFTDITQSKKQLSQLKLSAHFDSLTGLPNRVLLAERLQQAMTVCERRKLSLAVAYLDLDGFKNINDRHGHATGDELLIAVAKRMQSVMRDGDVLARIGGDEFVAVLSELAEPGDCEQALQRLLQAASEPVAVGEWVLEVSTSIGVTIYPQDGADADRLMRHADQAMYIAKQAGKNRFHLFDLAHEIAAKTQREGLAQVCDALQRREFVLFYQPKVNMKTHTVVGVEALIRWQHPERGLLLPGQFLPLIEDNPLCVDLGEWVIEEALQQVSSWRAEGLEMQVSVNICALQLQQTNFVSRLSTLIHARGDEPTCRLQLEVLETSALEDMTKMAKLMHACQTIGVHFALDDFGTGYSSLTYLRRLPIQLLKIDQTFVRDMLIDPDDLAIVNGVIGLAKAFGREVIAEGVETAAHGEKLLALGCELAQGHGIARPMPGADLPAWVSAWHERPDWLA
jgi:diguanylate cyclase (GGDEF)-like protein/PAS domain S-box-containing protein